MFRTQRFTYYELSLCLCSFFFNDTATTEIYTLSLHDALPISDAAFDRLSDDQQADLLADPGKLRSEEHTSELQSRRDLVCRLLLEKKKTQKELNNARNGLYAARI